MEGHRPPITSFSGAAPTWARDGLNAADATASAFQQPTPTYADAGVKFERLRRDDASIWKPLPTRNYGSATRS
jgi:hypothetical protein